MLSTLGKLMCAHVFFKPNLILYPMVGLQSQGELVETNFGESPFMFDFEGMLKVSLTHKGFS